MHLILSVFSVSPWCKFQESIKSFETRIVKGHFDSKNLAVIIVRSTNAFVVPVRTGLHPSYFPVTNAAIVETSSVGAMGLPR